MMKQTFCYRFAAAPSAVYRALLDPQLLPRWRVPQAMTMTVHHFEPTVGGKFRVTLSYEDPAGAGKSGTNHDTYHGYFAELVPNKRVVEVLEFESENPAFAGEMRITTELVSENGGTKLVANHENLPLAVPLDQNELGWKEGLGRLAVLLGS